MIIGHTSDIIDFWSMECNILVLRNDFRVIKPINHMRNILLFLLFCGSVTLGVAQTETLFDGNIDYGGFGGPMIEFSNINGQLVGDVGGGGGLVINSFFVGGYGLGNDGASVTIEEELYDIDFGHGGFWLGAALPQHKLFHAYASFRVGWGEVELEQNGDKMYDDNLLALAPELGIELNVTDWFKLGFSGGYRMVSGLDNLPVLDDSDFTGAYGALTFRFGGFGDYSSYDNDDDDNNFDFDF